mgnify:CR=1 FL=1
MFSNNKKFYLWVLGCQMNKSDSERIEALLEFYGWNKTNSELEASLIVVIACSVRQTAIDRIYGKVKNWQNKRRKGKLKIVLTGCVLASDKEKMSKFFDLIIPITEIYQIINLIGVKNNQLVEDYLCLPVKYNSNFSAYVPIMNGCNNFCSYCAVPFTRGREKSRSADKIIIECKKLIERGYKEIILLGQNVNSYHDGEYNFPKLLKKINQLPGDFWIRFLTSHPKDLSDDLIEVMAEGGHITPYLHLALQSGDKNILQSMNRKYSPEHFLSLIKKVRRAIPNITISTDIIVGYPGEGEEEFQHTAELMCQIKFDMAYFGRFSPRPGTAAAKLNDNVSAKEKARREKILNEILIETAIINNKKYLGQEVEVLVDGWKRGLCYGKTASFKIVAFVGEKSWIGHKLLVKIKEIGPWSLKGEKI